MAVTKVLSIEVTDIVTRVIEVDYGKKDPVVHKAIVFPTPEKTVSDGVIEGVETFAKEFQRQIHGFGTKNVVFTLATNKVISREITIPDMKNDLIADFIENQKSEYFPMDTSGHTMVHRVLDRSNNQIKAIVYAVPQKLVANYQSFASLAGLTIVGIDYNGNAIYQWLQNDSHRKMDMYLQINERSTLFTVLEDRKYALQRNINFGAYVLADRLMQSGYFDGEELDQAFTRKDALKKLTEEEFVFPSLSAAKLSEPDSEAAEKLHSAKEMVTEGMRQLLGNLSRVLEYYHSKNQNAELNTIFVGGCGARVRGLKAFLENEFSGIEVVTLDQLPDVKISSQVSKSGINTSEFIACIGAAEGTITFITAAKSEKTNKVIFVAAIAVLAAIAGAVALFFIGRGRLSTKENKQSRLKYEIGELESSGIEALESEYNNALAMKDEIILVDDSTFEYSEYWNSILAEMEEKSVSSLIVSSVSGSQDALNFNMTVATKQDAAKMLMQLQTFPYFESVEISSITEDYNEATLTKYVTFSVNCKYKKYFDEDINGDGKVDANDDKNGDGIIDKLDKYGDYNMDGTIDRRDVEAAENDIRKEVFELIKNDINGDGVVDSLDDINQDGSIDDTDRQLYRLSEMGLDLSLIDFTKIDLSNVDLSKLDLKAMNDSNMNLEEALANMDKEEMNNESGT